MAELPDHELRRLRAVADDEHHLEELVGRRLAGEPLQYLEGTAAFADLDLVVDERVLVPRPETEGLFELAARMVLDPKVIVDLCTGSGALALALEKEFPDAKVYGTDISEDALDVARLNGVRTGLDVEWLRGDLFQPLPPSIEGRVDLIVANPPYVAETEFESLPTDVKREPRVALISGPSGLEVLERIGAEASKWLRGGGVIVVEISETQGETAPPLFEGIPMEVRRDLTGRDRYVVGVKP
ncbi:MAG TPA: peptide chain release factor N(5)-glutamine methyltransferase [Acidimicrobiia bacterium]